MLAYFKYKNKYDIPFLVRNGNMQWSEEIIEELKGKINVNLLYSNNSFNNSEKLIDTYGNDTIIWNMTYSKSVWTMSSLRKYADKINWHVLSRYGFDPWNFEILEEFQNNILWSYLSYNIKIPWTIEMLEKYKNKIVWQNFSVNKYLSKGYEYDCRTILEYFNGKRKINSKFINDHLNNIYWGHLSLSSDVEWTPEFIDRYKDELDWKELSANETVPWTSELIERYKDKWYWYYLSGVKSMPWSPELIERYEVYWKWPNLSDNKSIPWTPEMILKYKHRLAFDILIQNKKIPWIITIKIKRAVLVAEFRIGAVFINYEISKNITVENAIYKLIPWTPELIERYKDKWNWRYLSDSKTMPWSVELIERYKNYWDWSCLSSNEAFFKKINNELTSKLIITGFISDSALSRFRNDPLYDYHLLKEISLFL
jgi:hypothetical protein